MTGVKYAASIYLEPAVRIAGDNHEPPTVICDMGETVHLVINLNKIRHVITSCERWRQEVQLADESAKLEYYSKRTDQHRHALLQKRLITEWPPDNVTSQDDYVSATRTKPEGRNCDVFTDKRTDHCIDWLKPDYLQVGLEDEQPREKIPEPRNRRDSTELLVEEARRAAQARQSPNIKRAHQVRHFDNINHRQRNINSDTDSHGSRSTRSSFDLSEQTEDSVPRHLVPQCHKLGAEDMTQAEERMPSFIYSHR